MNTQYYEAVLQLRGTSEKEEEYVARILAEERAFISKVKHYKNGIDLYISSRKAASKTGRMLVNEFGGSIKVSKKLHSQDRQTSRKIYRVTTLYKHPGFSVGDIVCFKNGLYQITGVRKGVAGINLKTRKKTYIKAEPEKVEVIKTIITKTSPRLEVMHPQTYESVQVENTASKKQGEKVKVAIYDGRVWIV